MSKVDKLAELSRAMIDSLLELDGIATEGMRTSSQDTVRFGWFLGGLFERVNTRAKEWQKKLQEILDSEE